MGNLMKGHESVSVTFKQLVRVFQVFFEFFSLRACIDCLPSFVSLLDQPLKLLTTTVSIIPEFFMIITFSYGTLKMSPYKSRVSTFHTSVGSVQLGPSFFKQANPDFTLTFTTRECQLILQCWKVVINDHWSKDPVDKKVYKVDPSIVLGLSYKEGLNQVRYFS